MKKEIDEKFNDLNENKNFVSTHQALNINFGVSSSGTNPQLGIQDSINIFF